MQTLSRDEKEKLLALKREKRIRLARTSLWEFCRAESPKFYTDTEWHLRILCEVLQALYERQLTKQFYWEVCENFAPLFFIDSVDWDSIEDDFVFTKLMLNEPPRTGKSRTLINFSKWCFGKSQENKVITTSYNDKSAFRFSKNTRDGISQVKNYPHEIIYNDIFPNVYIQHGNASIAEWALDGQFFSYKGAGIGGSVTGTGCNIAIVDDPVKDASEAFNDGRLEVIWEWYTGTFISRLEENGFRIMNMTRWAKKDPCGMILSSDGAKEWFLLKMESMYGDGQMLCPRLISKKSYDEFKRDMEPAIFRANHHQEPIDIQGILYKSFKTYTDIPMDEEGNSLFEKIIAYGDTADEGDDYLCIPAAGVYKGELYMIEVLYTKEGMEITEPAAADMLVNNGVNAATIESNSGGRGYARAVERIIWEKHKTRAVSVKWLHQSKNKRARILSNSTFIMEHVYMPVNWKDKWPGYYEAMTTYQKEGKNKNDDAPDATTGLVEMLAKNRVGGPVNVVL